MSDVQLIQVIVSVDGALFQAVIPSECKPVLLRLMQGLSKDGGLNLVRLPADVVKIPLSEAINATT